MSKDVNAPNGPVPAKTSTKTLLIVYKPIVHAVDLRNCVTLRDIQDLRDDNGDPLLIAAPDFEFEMGVGLEPRAKIGGNGGYLDADANQFRGKELNYFPRLREPYYIKIKGERTSGGLEPIPIDIAIEVAWTDTVEKLMDTVEVKTCIPLASQRLEFDGKLLSSNDRLLTHNITAESTIILSCLPLITFWFKDDTTFRTEPSNPLKTLLHSFAQSQGENLADLRFTFHQRSGVVDPVAGNWLSDKSNLFDADCFVGTVGENGLVHTDRIRVYRQEPIGKKRKRDEDTHA